MNKLEKLFYEHTLEPLLNTGDIELRRQVLCRIFSKLALEIAYSAYHTGVSDGDYGGGGDKGFEEFKKDIL